MNTQIKFTKNDSFAFYVTINKITELLDNVYFTVKLNPDDDAIIQKTLGAGITLVDDRLYKNQLSYKVQLDGFDTECMEVGTHYFFDIKAVKGNAQETLLAGELILSETQTGYINPAQQGDVVAIAEVYNAQFITDAGQSVYIETEVDPVAMEKIGDMTELNTTEKDTIVKAVNEVKTANDTEVTARTSAVSAEATARETADEKIKTDIEGGVIVPLKATNSNNIKAFDGNFKSLAAALLEMVYPVGSIKMTTENTNPSTYLGGTWVAWGAGRVPVGVDTDDTGFATVEKTGGEKTHQLTTSEMPNHNHSISINPDQSGYGGTIHITTNNNGNYVKYLPTATSTDNKIALEAALGAGASCVTIGEAGVGISHNNLQPYITCYMWKRTV